MKTKIIKLLEFNELSKEQQEKVIENNYYINIDCRWWGGYINEKFIETLKKLGFCDTQAYFSGFNSQGDGACFTGEFNHTLSIDGIVKNNKIHDLMKEYEVDSLIFRLSHSGNYYHEHSVIISSIECYDSDIDYTSLEDDLLTYCKSLMVGYYKDLEREYEYLTSRKAIIETIENYNYYFNSETLAIETL